MGISKKNVVKLYKKMWSDILEKLYPSKYCPKKYDLYLKQSLNKIWVTDFVRKN